MKAIFDNYGRVITAVIAILAIIGIVTATMPLMQENYKSLNTQMMAKVGNEDSTPSGGGNGGGSAPSQTDYGINIMQWDVSKNQDNSVVANYYVKEENQHPQQSQNAVMSLFKPMTAYAANNKTVTIDGVTYTLSDDDTIVISGSGEMMDNLQSKLCDYNKIYELTDKKFENEFAELENKGVEFGGWNKKTNTFTNKHYGLNATELNSYIKYNKNYYYIYDSDGSGFYGVYLCEKDMNEITTTATHINSSLETDIMNLYSKVKEYMSSIMPDNSVVIPKNLIISEGITNVGQTAFKGCNSLENVFLPESCVTIEPGAFFGTSIKNILLPKKLQSIGFAAFWNSKIETIEIPDSVSEIGYAAFDNCNELTSIKLSTNIKDIKNRMFYGCKKLETINLPYGITNIEYSAFYNCVSLKKINIPNSVKNIGESAFMNCSSLKEINLPEGITTISKQGFAKCSALTSINIPNSVTNIGSNAFGGCTNIKEFKLSKNITKLDQYAFYNLAQGTTIYCENQAVADLFKDGTNYKSSTTKIVVDATKFA